MLTRKTSNLNEKARPVTETVASRYFEKMLF